jgi:hypothetical protein
VSGRDASWTASSWKIDDGPIESKGPGTLLVRPIIDPVDQVDVSELLQEARVPADFADAPARTGISSASGVPDPWLTPTPMGNRQFRCGARVEGCRRAAATLSLPGATVGK